VRLLGIGTTSDGLASGNWVADPGNRRADTRGSLPQFDWRIKSAIGYLRLTVVSGTRELSILHSGTYTLLAACAIMHMSAKTG